MATSTIHTGAPHFASIMKKYRQANYNLNKIINEFVDNAIKNQIKSISIHRQMTRFDYKN